ncbi:YjbH domain-containing protein [Thalassorhabdomicrobium marinisediminis]|uniref:YjbH domain-containing protein n=1 Tax=Thalassorhabdomicrobium marinisediminis TaxID=2170577 RepID=UPI00248FDC6A|nr:YjbH domain-containing protein [Thalassorhabdomicrobium marinisediminis]
MFSGIAALLAAGVWAAPGAADQGWPATYSLFGTPGIVDMPTAVAPADAEIAATVSGFGETRRGTLTFQVLPRLSGSFRYSLIDTYDRSFDLQYQITDEGRYMPAVAVGLRDFIGTGRYSSEYFVATKTVSPNVRVTGGIGWGRLGSVNGFANPFGLDTRPDDSVDTGGTVLAGQFFHGDAALFGGVEWRVNDEWTLLAEYSSDAYERESDLIGFDRKSPVNVGVTWRPSDSYQLGAYYMHGSEIGVSASVVTNPRTRSMPSGLDRAPVPVAVRGESVVAAATWTNPQVEAASMDALGTIMATDGFRLLGAEVTGNTLRVRYENDRFRSEAQGAGRVARILTQVAPQNVDRFVLEPTQRGIALSSVTLLRSDMERLENQPNAAALSYDRARIGDASGPAPALDWNDPTPAFQWGLSPYFELTLFDGKNPARGDTGLEASFRYEVEPNIVLSGAFRQRLLGNRDEVGSIAPSSLPPVRRDSLRYGAQSGNGIEDLTLAWYGRPGRNVYSRITAGYLERMFGGVSAEVLWKPVASRLALGAEVNYAAKRDYDLGFGFQDYDIVTGHVSAYYEFANGFEAQVDVGRYLAGDYGATFGLDRTFANGWKVGAYFTLTDVPFDDFGEGSFDKGIRVEIPTDWLAGTPNRNTAGTTLSSLSRDGGARLNVEGRLYDVIEDGHQMQLDETWGRFWR